MRSVVPARHPLRVAIYSKFLLANSQCPALETFFNLLPRSRQIGDLVGEEVIFNRMIGGENTGGIVAGAKEASKIARRMIESGWADMKTFEAEVWRRVRIGQRRLDRQR